MDGNADVSAYWMSRRRSMGGMEGLSKRLVAPAYESGHAIPSGRVARMDAQLAGDRNDSAPPART